ncbi:MAG: YdgA family protein [Pasteurellaceae bacterium]|nr:YdgA family protein [Pasteurellaceae bacterium]
MRLKKVVMSIVAVIGFTVAGGSWYTGKQVEQHYQQFLDKTNDSLKQLNYYGINASLNVIQFDRGWFSSDIAYRIDVQLDKTPYHIHGKDTLYHGPLPFNRLLKGNIVPVMASTESQMNVPEQIQALMDNKLLLSGQGSLTYGGVWQGHYQISPIKSDIITTSAIEYDVEWDNSGGAKGKVNVGEITFNSPNAVIPSSLNMRDLVYDFDFNPADKAYPLLSVGQSTFKLKSMILDHLDSDMPFSLLALYDLSSSNRNAFTNGRLMGESDFSANLLLSNPKHKSDFGQIRLNVNADTDAKATHDFIHGIVNNAPHGQASDDAIAFVFKLIGAGISFNLNEFSLENSKGKSQLALNVNLQANPDNQLANFEEILQLFKQSQLSITLNRAMAEEAVKQFVSFYPQWKERAEHIAKEDMANLVQWLQQTELADVASTQITLTLSIDQGQFKLNGKAIPQEQVQGLLFMLILGLGSL